PIVVRTDLIIPDFTIRTPQLQGRDCVIQTGHERFVAYCPTYTHRREETPPVMLGKPLRTIQSISELYIVTGIVPISQPACRRDIPPWQGSLKLIGHPLIVVNRSRRIPDRTDQGPTEIVLTVQKLTVCQPYFPVLGGIDR